MSPVAGQTLAETEIGKECGTGGAVMRIPTWAYRLGFNLFPAYRSTGAWITDLAADFSYMRIKLPLKWRTKNIVGTMFGGSMFAAADPIYMVMLRERLGDDYTVWDKAGSIRFKRPGEDTLYAEFHLPDDEVIAIESELDPGESVDREFSVDLVDDEGVVHAEVTKTIYIERDT